MRAALVATSASMMAHARNGTIGRPTRQRDLDIKRAFYLKTGVQEYWVVDRYSRSVRRFTADTTQTITSVLSWAPRGCAATLGIDVGTMFREIIPGVRDP